MDVSHAIITRMNALCAAKGITINGLCNRAGVTQSTVHDIMASKTHSPGVATLKKLCDGLDVSIREFFNTELFDDLDQEIK
ncbi:MAG: helix-turn-helix domain-containing protein [Oscillospiraceae bacterium]|jgi:transcriptional regulator with XRE-family HTH domain|nr:helix-turn-helix domain-containing protein [Oscillospiraceae bacterium]